MDLHAFTHHAIIITERRNATKGDKMYFILVNRKNNRIVATADTEAEIVERLDMEVKYVESQGQRNPGYMIETRD